MSFEVVKIGASSTWWSLRGDKWIALSEGNEKLNIGDTVEVLRVAGVKLIVRKV